MGHCGGKNGRLSYYFRGEAIDECAKAQSLARSGEVILSQTVISSPFQLSYTPIEAPNYYRLTRRPNASLIPVTRHHVSNQQIAKWERPFVPPSVQAFRLQAEFRTIAPIFISFHQLDTHQALNSFVSTVIHLTDRYGGTFSQLDFGDKGGVIVIWFGAPLSHENNSERAVTFLVALQEYAQFKDKWRAGVTHGLVWAGIRGAPSRDEYGAMGNVVNTAARLAFKADWGTIWVDENIAEQVHHHQKLTSVGDIQLKGLIEKTAVYRVTTQPQQLSASPSGAFIGRQSELTFLNEAIKPIFKNQLGGVIYINGEAGIGKSRLLVEWLRQNREHIQWLNCPANDILKQSLNPIRAGLSQYFSIAPFLTVEENRSRLRSKINAIKTTLISTSLPISDRLIQSLEKIEPHFQQLLNLREEGAHASESDPKLHYQNSLDSITTFIKCLSMIKPLILLVEDAHWLDQGTKSYLSKLPNALLDFPVVIIITSRRLASDQQFSLDLSQHVPTSHLSLTRLSSSQSETLIKSLADPTILPNTLHYLREKSNGNPLFLKQLTHLINEKADNQSQNMLDSSALVEHQINPQLPKTINDLLVSRLDQLEPKTKKLVQLSAVLGQKTSSKVLRAFAAEDQINFEQCRETAVRQNIWRDTSKRECHFVHALMRDAAYMMQMQSQKRELHLQAAQTLEALFSHDLESHLEEIGHHYESAYHLGEDSALNTALHYLQFTADEAIAKYKNWSAIDHLQRALAICPEHENELIFSIKAKLIKTYSILGERAKQAELFEELEAQFSKFDSSKQTEYLLLFADYYFYISQYEKLPTIAYQGIQIAEKNADTLSIGKFHLRLGQAYHRHLQFDKSQAHFQKAQKYALWLEDSNFLAHVYWAHGSLYFDYNKFETAEKYFKHVLNIYTSSDNLLGQAKAFNGLAASNASRGNFSQAKKDFLTCQQLANDIGDKHLNAVLLGNLGRLAFDLNEFDEAEERYLQSLSVYKEVGELHGVTLTYNNLGMLFKKIGYFRISNHYLRKGLEHAKKIVFKRDEIKLLGQLADNAISLGDFTLAMELQLEAVKLAQTTDYEHLITRAKTRLGICYYHLGEFAEAIACLELSLDYWINQNEDRSDNLLEVLVYLSTIFFKTKQLQRANDYLADLLLRFDANAVYAYASHPFNIHWLLYKLLKEMKHKMANTILDAGYQQLQAISSQIQNPEYQDNFLNHVTIHKNIVSEWRIVFLEKALVS
ncbi:MAG: tetratricopeptide repeat protein [Chloroflexota bacterium]